MTESTYKRMTPFLRQLLAVSGVVMYMIGSGENIAFPGVLLMQLREPGSEVRLTPDHESWIASILGLALVAGIMVAPFSLQNLGRKMTNQLSSLPTLAGWGLLAASNGPTALMVSRSLVGFGMGIHAAASSVSIAEYSAPKHRGAFLATIAFSFATGMLTTHVFGTFLPWRTAGLACGSVYIISLILVTLVPETPPYLASRGRVEKCKKSFYWFRGHDPISEKELNILLHSQRKPAVIPIRGSRWQTYRQTVRKPEFYKPTLIMMFMFVLFQISGMTVIPSYTVPIMREVTGGAFDSYVSMLAVDVVRFVTAVISCFIINKLPRRTVLFTSISITVVSLLSTAILLYIRNFGYLPEEYKWTPIVPFTVYIIGKTLGILSIPWAIAGEVFPLKYRSIGGGISGMFLSIMLFVVVKTAPYLFEWIGYNGTFCVYAVCVAICGMFLFYLLPETKGKTLHDIECHFKGIKSESGHALPEGQKMLDLKNVESR